MASRAINASETAFARAEFQRGSKKKKGEKDRGEWMVCVLFLLHVDPSVSDLRFNLRLHLRDPAIELVVVEFERAVGGVTGGLGGRQQDAREQLALVLVYDWEGEEEAVGRGERGGRRGARRVEGGEGLALQCGQIGVARRSSSRGTASVALGRCEGRADGGGGLAVLRCRSCCSGSGRGSGGGSDGGGGSGGGR